ncbi:MAG: hypothetical protein COA49_09415 [Bacteroidetes bacterium]|nr:MAG: hypothetical protein COA49_09415 [Bacteroidota bacterium]
MGTGATDIPSVTINPTGLLLRWDGREVQWAFLSKNQKLVGHDYIFGSRKVTRISMLPEVVRALKGRYKSLNKVVYAKRFNPSTIVPAIVLENNNSAAEKWFKLHHASSVKDGTRVVHLESVEGEPVFVEGVDKDWDDAVKGVFPQAQAVIQSAALMNVAVGLSRHNHESWVIIVDAGTRGADLVAANCGKGVWSGVTSGGDVEDVLYSVVNALHRADVKPDDVLVKLAGEGLVELESTFKKFFKNVQLLGNSEMEGLKALAS